MLSKILNLELVFVDRLVVFDWKRGGWQPWVARVFVQAYCFFTSIHLGTLRMDGKGPKTPFVRRQRPIGPTHKQGNLELRTPSGRYPVRTISYGSDPHILLTDPFMWNCQDGNKFRPTRPFSLDTSTHLSLSSLNEYLFFNCSESHVIIEPKPVFCERNPERCDSSCDSSAYLCRHMPDCGSTVLFRGGSSDDDFASCCSYYPKATESLRLMLRYCTSYTSVYWRNTGETQPYDQVPEYGVRVDFETPVTTNCLRCQDMNKGDHSLTQHRKVGVIAGTASAASVAGVLGIGAGVWYLKKVRAKAPVTCGVQSNDNRLF
uniref:Wall-associated receptor kinase galacturonan-binding domain-containing protein n=1 Tax=Cannabis sativa TaxID=3483 RepID=A0A803NZJ2_CANSA